MLAIWSPFQNKQERFCPSNASNSIKELALICRASLSIHFENIPIFPQVIRGLYLVTDAYLRMGLTQHTVRSDAA